MKLRGVSWDWRTEEFPERHFSDEEHWGFIAQEFELVLPELVATDEKSWKSINYIGMVPVIAEAMKEQQEQMKEQQEQMERLELRLGDQEKLVTSLLNDKHVVTGLPAYVTPLLLLVLIGLKAFELKASGGKKAERNVTSTKTELLYKEIIR